MKRLHTAIRLYLDIIMTKEERFAIILDKLMQQESIPVANLSADLKVSLVTIRKDLTELESMGKLYRSHGKAILINPFAGNRSINEKERLASEEKMLIGQEAAKLITKDDSILLASGTTIHALARCIKPIHRLTVVSASLPASEILSQDEDIDVIQLGGRLRHSSVSVVGDYSDYMLKDCSFSKLFIGVDGIDFEFGITTTDMREATLNKMMMKAAHKTIVLADSSKFGKRGFARIAEMEDIDMIITDSRIKPVDIVQIEDLGIKLVIAPSKDLGDLNNETEK